MSTSDKEKPVKKYELEILELHYESLRDGIKNIDRKIDNFVTTDQLDHKMKNVDVKIKLVADLAEKDVNDLEKNIDLKYGPALGFIKWAVLAVLTGLVNMGYLLLRSNL